MAIVHINGNDRTDELKVGSMRVTRGLQKTTRGRFRLVDLPLNLVPKVGHSVTIFDENGDKVMGGTVEDRNPRVPDPGRWRDWDIDVVSHEILAEKRAITEAWANTDGDQIVKDIISKVLTEEGITEGTIQSASQVTQLEANISICASVLDRVSEKTGFQWTINPDRSLDFTFRDNSEAPWDLNSGNFDRILRDSIDLTQSRSKYRNRQYIKGIPGVIQKRVETFSPNSPTRVFELDFALESMTKIEVDTGGGFVDETDHAIDMFENLGTIGQVTGSKWIWHPGHKKLEMNQARASLTNGDTLKVTYQGRGRGAVVAENADAISDRNAVEPGSGIWVDIKNKEFSGTERALEYARGLVRRYDSLEVDLDFETYRKDLAIGQVQLVDLPEFDVRDTEMAIIGLTLEDIPLAEAPKTGNYGTLKRTVKLSSLEAHNPVAADQGGEDREGNQDTNNQVVVTPPNPSASLIEESGSDESPSQTDSDLDASDAVTPLETEVSDVWLTVDEQGETVQANGMHLVDTDGNPIGGFAPDSVITARSAPATMPSAWWNGHLLLFDNGNGWVYEFDVSDPDNPTKVNETSVALPGNAEGVAVEPKGEDASNQFVRYGVSGGGGDPKITVYKLDPNNSFTQVSSVTLDQDPNGLYDEAPDIQDERGYTWDRNKPGSAPHLVSHVEDDITSTASFLWFNESGELVAIQQYRDALTGSFTSSSNADGHLEVLNDKIWLQPDSLDHIWEYTRNPQQAKASNVSQEAADRELKEFDNPTEFTAVNRQ